MDKFNKTISTECGDFILDFDILIVGTIKMLNKKGYKTKYCCSGHPKITPLGRSYIFFRHKYDITIPEGYSLDLSSDKEFLVERYFNLNSETLEEQQKAIIENAIKLYKCAKELPQLNK